MNDIQGIESAAASVAARRVMQGSSRIDDVKAWQFDALFIGMLLKTVHIDAMLGQGSTLDNGMFSRFFTQYLAEQLAQQNSLGFGAMLIDNAVAKGEKL